MKRKKIFVSYSHKDQKWLEKTQPYLNELKDLTTGIDDIDVWTDKSLKAGEIWEEEITKAMSEARFAILLISDNFFASEFIMKRELPHLLEAAKKKDLIILSLHLSDTDFTGPLSEFQSINLDSPLEYLNKVGQDKKFEALTTRVKEILLTDVRFDSVFDMTWIISCRHIDSLLRGDQYDRYAKLKEPLRDERNESVKFFEKRFVAPKEEEHLEKFISSDKRGIIIIGKSGMGKSNLLCHFFLEQRRAKALSIFIDARKLASVKIEDFLEKSIEEKLSDNWGLKEFDTYLEDTGKKITLIIDAVNEFNNEGGAIGLLMEICAFIEAPTKFRNVKVIASCRIETWDLYKEKIGNTSNVLSTEYFFPESGDAVTLSGFEDEDKRKSLYSTYQEYYYLTPKSYDELSPAVKELIKQPIMMGLIAETYSNRYADSDEASTLPKFQEIRKKLDYFSLFELLTDRKLADAKRLLDVRGDTKWETFDKSFKRCIHEFARILYYKIVESDMSEVTNDSKDKSDSLQYEQLDKNNAFHDFLNTPISSHNQTTMFLAIVQVGLLERIDLDGYDQWGGKESIKAVKFFHDQYTQFSLSAVFNSNDVLGMIKGLDLKSNENLLNAIIPKMEKILANSRNAPVLSGALYHWLYINMFENKNLTDRLAILFNRLVEKDSNIVNYFVGSFLHWLIEANIVPANKLIRELVKNGSAPLRRCFYEHIQVIWTEFSHHTLRAIIAKENDNDMLRRLGDIFMNVFTSESGEKVIEVLDKALVSYESLGFKDLPKKVLEAKRLPADFTFMQTFFISSLLCNFKDPDKLESLWGFLKRKYKGIFSLLAAKDVGFIRTPALSLVRILIKKNSLHQWKQAVESNGKNKDFFNGKEEGQRDILRRFYKFCADFHNGDMENLSLDSGSEYMEITLRMLEYGNRSIIGYIATLMLMAVVKDNMGKLSDIVAEIINRKSNAAHSFGVSMLHMLSKIEPESIMRILDIIHYDFFPAMKDNYEEGEYALTSFFAIGATDFDRYWGKCEQIFSDMLGHLRQKNDPGYIKIFEEMMIQAFLPPDINIGVKICEYLLDKKMHYEGFWKGFTLKMLACMLAKSPRKLKQILDEKGVDESLIDKVGSFLTEDIRKARSEVSYKHGWNNFIVYSFTENKTENKKLSYLLIKYLLTSLVQSENEIEFSKVAPKLVADFIRTFVMDDGDKKLSHEHLRIARTLPAKGIV